MEEEHFFTAFFLLIKKKRAPKPSLPSGKVEDFFPVKPQMLFIERTADQPVKLSVPTDTSEASNMFIAH